MKHKSLIAPLVLVAGACSQSGPSAGPDIEPPPWAEGSPGGSGAEGPNAPGVDSSSVPLAGLPLAGAPIFSRFVRLTHDQWERSVRDVLQLEDLPGLSQGFTGDPPNGTFSNNERALLVTPNLRLDYQRAAETLSEQVARNAAALGRLGQADDPAAFIAAVGRRIYRRPLSADETQRFATLFEAGASVFESGDAFADGAQLVLEAMLQSPHFVYRTELGDDGAALSGYEIASKLSFLLRNTTPDDELLDAAAAGDFDTRDGLIARAGQMLDDPGAAEAVARYHAELFGLERYLSIAKDPGLFPEHDPAINASLAHAEELFLDRLFEQGYGLNELLTSTVGFANAEMAPLYGVDVSGDEFQQVDLGADRPGLFTRLGFLAYNGTLRDPDSIHRGVEINSVVLCATLSPPPGVIPALPNIAPGQTNRERVNAHTGPGTCGESCHGTIINPIGFAFENFDALGQWRDTDNGKPVETAGTYRFADGLKDFNDAPELMALIADSPQAHACFAQHLAEYGLGRDLSEADRDLVDSLQVASMASNASIKQSLMAVVSSPAFGRRSGGE